MTTTEILQSAGKNCTACGDEFPATAEYFSRQSAAKDGLQPWCKICAKIYRQSEKGKMAQTRREKKRWSTVENYLRYLFTSMKQRCINPNNKNYNRYGGRGIKIHFKSVDEFIHYIMGVLKIDPRGLTIDRIDNNGNYEPGNIRFITQSENSKNRKIFGRGVKK